MSDYLARLRRMLKTHRNLRRISYPAFPNRAWLLAQRRLLQLQAHYVNRGGGRMTQRNVRGCYLNFEHDRPQDWDWLAKWQPNVIRYMGPGNIADPGSFSVDRVRRIHETCPAATILLRCWDVDDNNFKAHDAMVANPRAEADAQVNWWAGVIARAEAAGVPRHLLMAGLNNETGPEKDASLYTYSEWALKYAIQRKVRLGVFVFSVGRPSLVGEAAIDMGHFVQLEPLILDNNGAVVLHEYLQPEGMYAVWTDEQGNERKDYTYLIGRHMRWPFSEKVPIIIGEWGIDGILYNRHPDPKYGNAGWRNFKAEWPPNRYADEYVECVRQASDNVIGICPFIEDWSDHKWQSFDLIDAYGEFLARKDLCVKDVDATQPIDTHLPAIGNGKPPTSTQYVTATAGANIRSEAVTGDILTAVPYGHAVAVYAHDDDATWLPVRYEGISGWMYGRFLSDKQPGAPTPPEPPEKPADNDHRLEAEDKRENWEWAIAFVLQEEGGLSTDPNDPGNYVDGRFVGTNFGISANAHPGVDIVNLTVEQAKEIYYRSYWGPSGAAALRWPLCLAVFDLAVNGGVGRAKEALNEVGPDFVRVMAWRIDWYTRLADFERYGRAWERRCARLMMEAAK